MKEELLSKIVEGGFERVAKRIELFWDEPDINHIFTSLIISDREHRQGFPPEVMEAILKLYRLRWPETEYDVWLENNLK